MRGTGFVLSFLEEQRLKVLANGSLNQDYSDSSDDAAKESSDTAEEASESLPDNSHQPALEDENRADLDVELPDFSYNRGSYIVKAVVQQSP